MGVYLTLFKKSFLEEYIYKANLWLKIFRNIVYIFIAVSIWTNLLQPYQSVDSVKLRNMVSYIIMALFIRNLVDSNVARSMADKIRDGSIIFYFTIPANFNLYLFSDQFGKNVFETLFSTVPVCVAAYFYWGGTFLTYQTLWPVFILSLVLSVIIF